MAQANRLKPVTKSHYLVQSPQLPDFFATEFSGLDIKADVTKYADGQIRQMGSVVGMMNVEDLTLSAPYSEKLRALFDRLKALLYSQESIQVSVQETTSAIEPTFVGQPYNFFGCNVYAVKILEADRSSADVSLITFSCTVSYAE